MHSLWIKCKYIIQLYCGADIFIIKPLYPFDHLKYELLLTFKTTSVNITQGTKQYRHMITGKYLVSDISCHQCGNLVGWKYHLSEVKNQKYKEGKYILELQTIVKCK